MTARMKSSPIVSIVFTCLLGVIVEVFLPCAAISVASAQQTQPAGNAPRVLERVHFGDTVFVTPASRPAWPVVAGAGESYAAQIHAIIQQTPRGHADLLEPLAIVVAANNDPRKVALASARPEQGSMNTDDFPRLVDALLEGDADDQLRARVMAQVHVDSYLKTDADWKYGTVIARDAVQRFLWIRAVAMKDTDPAAAARFARACVLFAAYDEIPVGRTGVVWAINRTDPPFATVARLSDAQMQMIGKMVDADQTMVRSVGMMQNTLADSIDSWVDAQSPVVSAVQRERFLTLLEKWWINGDAPKVPMTAWQVANGSWRVMNLARSVGDQETIDAVTQVLRRLEAELTNADEQLWLEEAITMAGPAPRRSAPFIVAPNGRR